MTSTMRIGKFNGRSSGGYRKGGFSLVELLVAITLGLIIITAVTQLYADISRSNREMAKVNSQIENARFAMQFLRNDIVHAGYWGGHVPEWDDFKFLGVPTDDPNEPLPDACLSYASWTPSHLRKLISIPLQVDDNSAGASCPTNVIENHLVDTEASDILVIRHAEMCLPGVGNCDALSANELLFQTSNCYAEINAGSRFAVAAAVAALPLTEKDCTAAAEIRRFVQNMYWIRDTGDGNPTLMRSEFSSSAGSVGDQWSTQALVPGVERMRIEVGLDLFGETGDPSDSSDQLTLIDFQSPIDWDDDKNWTTALNRGDGIPETPFVHCTACTSLQLMNAVVAKIYLLVRADEPSPGYTDTKKYTLGSGAAIGPFNDGYQRHVFSNVVRLNNVAGRRETP